MDLDQAARFKKEINKNSKCKYKSVSYVSNLMNEKKHFESV